MDVFANLAVGLGLALQPLNLLMMVVGLVLGITAGALPGITMLNAIVLVLPFTYLMDITPALLLMGGIYCGGVFAGSITGILFNIPGDPMDVPATWEGYRLNRKGQVALALGVAITASAIGGFASALLMTFASPPFARIALTFDQAEFFAVVVLGLASVVVIGQASMSSAFISLLIGMTLGTVGVDPLYGSMRFTFGWKLLESGIDFVTVMIGLFAIGEILERLELRSRGEDVGASRARARLPRPSELWELRGSILRGTAVGIGIGGLAGAGATVSSFVAYGVERQFSKKGDQFGTGVLEGVAAPEAAANGSTGGAMIHLLTLGIPGSAATAVMMGAFLIHGLQPGPLLFQKQTAMVYTIFAGYLLINLIMIVLGLLAAVAFARILMVPEAILAAFIVVCCFIGAYALRNDLVDVWMMAAFGVIGYLMRRFKLPIPPLILGLILGPMAERFFRTSMATNGNDLMIFVTRPVSAVLLAIAAALLIWPPLRTALARRRAMPALVAVEHDRTR